MKIVKNEKTAEIVGLSFGDGSLTRRKVGKNKGKLRFQMRGHIMDDRARYDKYVKPLFDKTIQTIPTTIYKGKKPYYGIATGNQKICEYLKFLGVPVGVKGTLNIPHWISSNKEYLKAFLRGFIDTDGSVFCGRDYNYPKKGHIKIRMTIASTSYSFIKKMSKSLSNLSVHNLVIKPYKQKNPKWKNLNKILIDGPNVKDYFNIIGSRNRKHISKYEVWEKFGFCPPYTTLSQRESILRGNLDPDSLYQSDGRVFENAGVTEPGQMCKFTSVKHKVEGLVP